MDTEKLRKILEAIKYDMDERGDKCVQSSLVKMILEAILKEN